MYQISISIYDLLKTIPLLVSKNIDPQPIISDQDAEYPLVNYAISESTTYSKENKLEYVASIRVYAENYLETLKLVDAIKAGFGASTIQFKYNGTTEPQVDAYGQYYIESNYSFKNK